MTAYSKDHMIVEFASRTKSNLLFLESVVKSQPESKLYEVTQLINSLIGLIVLPFEKLKMGKIVTIQRNGIEYKRYNLRIPNKTLEEMEKEGWVAPTVIGNYPEIIDLYQLVYYLRNAGAHFNIDFESDPFTHQITGVKVEDYSFDRNRKVWEKIWEAELSIDALRDNVLRFIDIILQSEGKTWAE